MIGALIAKRKSAATFAALNRRDFDAFLEGWAEDTTFIYPGDVTASDTFAGKKAILNWYERWSEQFTTAHFTLKHVAFSNLFETRND